MTSARTIDAAASASVAKVKPVKCVIWDLDETLWQGTLLEDRVVVLRPEIRQILETLDQRGILHSIASRNEHDDAIRLLHEFQIDHFFLRPQINWGSKAESIKTIGRELGLGTDTFLFVDDQAFERDEVRFVLPEVRTIDIGAIETLVERDDLRPQVITADAQQRRQLYQAEIAREAAEKTFVGSNEDFLASLDMQLSIHRAGEHDLARAEELTIRTNQLNATGITYSYSELDGFRTSPRHRLLIARLSDRYGSYGTIGLALVECEASAWTVRLMLMSCRVVSRGVGTIMLREIIDHAFRSNVALHADFVATGRNRMMYITYQLAGFREFETRQDRAVLRYQGGPPAPRPSYLKVEAEL